MKELMEQWWVDIGRRQTAQEPISVAYVLPQFSRELACDRTRAAVLRGRRLIASDMVGLEDFRINCRPIKKIPFHTSLK